SCTGAGRASAPDGITLTAGAAGVRRACEKSREVTSCGSQLTKANATGATSKILRGRMFMGAFIVCGSAFVKSFLWAFWPLLDCADDLEIEDAMPLGGGLWIAHILISQF